MGAAGIGLGAGVNALLVALTQPPTVWVAVTAVVVVTVMGLPLAPLLHVKVPVTPVAVIVELPQLSTTDSVGAAGIGLGAGVTALLVALTQPPTVWVAVTAVVV